MRAKQFQQQICPLLCYKRITLLMISEDQFLSNAAECFVLLQKYKLKTNVVGINMDKQAMNHYYLALEARMTDRYRHIYDKLQSGIRNLEKNFVIAQANSLRTLNNIIRNYRRRVGTLSNEPLSNFKYNKYDKNEKILLESLIYSERENHEKISEFKRDLQISLEAGSREIQEKYKRNEKIKENYQSVLDVIDKSECYTFKYYENFERSMLATVSSLESYFDKLNAYLSVWENVGSTKAYQIKSQREIESEEKSHQNDRNLRFFEQESEQQLEQLMNNSPLHSPQREEYRKRLNDLRRYNNQKQKKLELVGKMFNKRRNRAGILLNKTREVSVLEWYINLDNQKASYSYHDQFKSFHADNDHSDYRLTHYQTQKPHKKAEDMRAHLQKFRPTPPLSHEWYYDRFGKDGTFDLISTTSNQIQKRVEFQVIRQAQLQNSDDRRKRQMLQKQSYIMKENERRQSLHIGYKHIHDKTELQWLTERSYSTEYIPQLYAEQHDQSISFSSDESSSQEMQKIPQRKMMKVKKQTEATNELPFVKIQNEEVKPIAEAPGVKQTKEERQIELEQQIVLTYFKEYSSKMQRKEAQPQYRKTQFLYFTSVEQVNWTELGKYMQFEKIFLVSKKTIFYFNRVFSVRQEKIKCIAYTLEEDLPEQNIRSSIRQCFFKVALVTVKFQPIYAQVDPQDLPAFMIGLLIVLLREGSMPPDYQNKNYLNEGKDIIEDFNFYFFPQDHHTSKNIYMRKFKPAKAKDVFVPNKRTEFEQEQQDSQSKGFSNVSEVTRTAPSIQVKPINDKVIEAKPVIQLKHVIEVEAVVQNRLEQPYLQLAPYNAVEIQPILKKSNSRQYLQSGDLQLELGLTQKSHMQEQDENDFEQL